MECETRASPAFHRLQEMAALLSNCRTHCTHCSPHGMKLELPLFEMDISTIIRTNFNSVLSSLRL